MEGMDQRGVFVGRGVAKFDFGWCMTSVPRRAGAFDGESDAHLPVLSATSKLMPDSGTLLPWRGFAVKWGSARREPLWIRKNWASSTGDNARRSSAPR